MKLQLDLVESSRTHLGALFGRVSRSRLMIAVLACCTAFSVSARATCGPSPTSGPMVAFPASAFHVHGPAQPASVARQTGNANPAIVGLWIATFYSGGQVFDQGFDQWHQDGTEILIDNSLPQPANGTGSACLGVYVKTGPRAYSLKHPFWIFDTTGNLAGNGLYLEQITVDPGGNNYRGTFTFETYDLSGNQTFKATGSVMAQRITVDD